MRSLILLAASVFFNTLFAQSDWMSPNASSSLYVDINKPFYKNDKYINFGTSVITLIPQFSYAPGKAVRVEIPYSIISFKSPFTDQSETGLGNLYIGTRSLSEDRANQWDIGVRLPTASDQKFNAYLNSSRCDYERLYAYLPDFAAAVFMFQHHRQPQEKGILYGVRFGSAATYITEDGVNEPMDFWAHYGLYGGFETDSFTGTIGFRGVLLISEGGSFGDRNISHLEVGARLKTSMVRPGILFKIPIDEEVSDVIESTVSLNFEFPIR